MFTELNWKGGMAFEALQDGHEITLDANPEFGGKDLGPRPKGLLLTALAGCTGMDVVSILQKMRVENFNLKIRVEGELAGEHPKVFTEIRLIYNFKGKNLPEDKLQKAINLSQEKYCAVSIMLRQVCEFSYEMKIES